MENISIILPTQNSELYIEDVLFYLGSLDWKNSEIIVIENGSFDSTWQRLTYLSQNWTLSIPLICKQSSVGLGNAIRVGISSSSRKYVWFTAQDLPFGLSDISCMYAMRQASGFFLGSKTHPKSNVVRSPVRRILSHFFRLARIIVLKQKLGDTQGTFFAPTLLMKDLIPHISDIGYLVTTEIAYVCAKRGIEVIEVPVVYTPFVNTRSSLNLFKVIAMFFGLFKIRSNHK